MASATAMDANDEGLRAPPTSKKLVWAGCIVSALPTLMLTLSAVMKLARPDPIIEGFTKLGYPADLALAIGLVELACVVIYVVPRTAILGAVLLTGYLGGATATHVRVGEPFIGPVILGALVWLGLYLRDARLRALLPLRS